MRGKTLADLGLGFRLAPRLVIFTEANATLLRRRSFKEGCFHPPPEVEMNALNSDSASVSLIVWVTSRPERSGRRRLRVNSQKLRQA